MKNYNVMIDEQNVFDQPVKNNLRTYGNIQKAIQQIIFTVILNRR